MCFQNPSVNTIQFVHLQGNSQLKKFKLLDNLHLQDTYGALHQNCAAAFFLTTERPTVSVHVSSNLCTHFRPGASTFTLLAYSYDEGTSTPMESQHGVSSQ